MFRIQFCAYQYINNMSTRCDSILVILVLFCWCCSCLFFVVFLFLQRKHSQIGKLHRNNLPFSKIFGSITRGVGCCHFCCQFILIASCKRSQVSFFGVERMHSSLRLLYLTNKIRHYQGESIYARAELRCVYLPCIHANRVSNLSYDWIRNYCERMLCGKMIAGRRK